MKYLFVLCFFFQFLTTSVFGQEYKYHTVKKGETVYSIAKSYNISEEDIYKYNPDARDGIEVSSKLVIPLSATKSKEGENNLAAVDFITHKVARHETLYSLAKQYNVEVDDIKKYNKQLYASELRTGEEIRIPVFHESAAQQVAQPQQERKVKIMKTRQHIVLPKETKYGIARKYGLTVRELEELNPTVDVLKPGTMLNVGTDVIDQPVFLEGDTFEYYEVKPRETLYGLTLKFEVSKDSLMALNPGLQDGLKSGMVLKVPNKGEGESKLSEEETERLRTGNEVAAEANSEKIDLRRSITNFDTKNLVLMLPYHLDKIEKDSLETYKKAILDERVLRISLDFYSGVLMAVDKAKELGISTNLQVYDTRQNAQEVSQIINSHNFSNVDAVIGPLLQNTTEAAAGRLQTSHVPVISPLSNRPMRHLDNLFLSRPTDEMLTEAMLAFLKEKAQGKNLVVIADPGAYELKSKIGFMFPNARFVAPGEGFVAEDKIAPQLSKQGENWVLLESSNLGVVSSATSALNRLSRDYNISLFTTNRNSAYENDNVVNEHL
ncbi:MAG: LysM peptidoglycan-binding domain-containing protein, partial [Salegentibacter sp.]